jgi:hypothetical protein
MNLQLTDQQASELDAVLATALRDLKHEMADTDNPGYGSELAGRFQCLSEVAGALCDQAGGAATRSREVLRQLAHPGT